VKLGFAWPWRRKAANSLDLFREIYGGRLAKSGQTVNWQTALQVSTVLACARVIANGLAQVPLKVFREADAKRLPHPQHPLYWLLHRRPNEWQTSFEFRQTMGLHLVLTGRHYSFVNRLRGSIAELLPLEPGSVVVKRAADGTLSYDVTGAAGKVENYPAASIWHVRGPSWSGWEGLDAVKLAREAIGLAIATEEQHARLHANGVHPNGTYSVEGKLSAEQYKQLRQHIVENTTGVNAGLPLIVDSGATWLQTAMSGVDAQHLETRRFQVEEVCRALGVSPLMVYSSDKATTYASAEQMFLAHVVHTLAPWYEAIEQSADVHLVGETDFRAGVYVKFIVAGLLRGAMKDRGEYLARALGSGGSPAWMTQDEVRALEELNPMGGAAAVLPIATNVPAAGGKTGTTP
jgi:HK97 family phage portal protein